MSECKALNILTGEIEARVNNEPNKDAIAILYLAQGILGSFSHGPNPKDPVIFRYNHANGSSQEITIEHGNKVDNFERQFSIFHTEDHE